jgi:hypothetical protein
MRFERKKMNPESVRCKAPLRIKVRDHRDRSGNFESDANQVGRRAIRPTLYGTKAATMIGKPGLDLTVSER